MARSNIIFKRNDSFIIRKIKEGMGFTAYPVYTEGVPNMGPELRKYKGFEEIKDLNPNHSFMVFLCGSENKDYAFFRKKKEFMEMV